MKLNLGCGKDIKKDYINIDILKHSGVDVVCNFEKGLPFKDNSFNYLYSKYSLEHIQDVPAAISDIHRIMKQESIAHIEVPHFSWARAYDIQHRVFFNFISMDCFSDKFEIAKRLSWGEEHRFKALNLIINAIVNRMVVFYERFLCWIFPVNKIVFDMIKK